MSVCKYALSFPLGLALLCLAFNQPSLAQEADSENVSEEKADLEKDVVLAIFDSTSSSNALIQDHAYALLAGQKNLHKHLSEKNISKLITESLNGKKVASEHGFAMLDNSNLSAEQKQDLLIGAISSEDKTVMDESLKRLTKFKKDLLPRIIKQIEAAPEGRHVNQLRVIENWGPEAKSALPVLIKNYEALRERALVKGIEKEKKLRPVRRDGTPTPQRPAEELRAAAEKRLLFEYLPLVYAIAEMGTDAKPAMKIALAAAQEKRPLNRNRMEYNMAGVLCIERIIGNQTVEKHVRDRNREAAKMMKALQARSGNNAMGGMMSNMIGFSDQSQRSIRSIIEDFNRRSNNNARDLEQDLINEKVDLIFQNHDLLSKSGQLTIEEIRNVTPPILLSRADKDDDEMVSRTELFEYLNRQKTRKTYLEALETSRNRSRFSRSR